MNLFDKKLKMALVGMTYPSEGEEQMLEFAKINSNLDYLTTSLVVESFDEDIDNFHSVNYDKFILPRLNTGT